MDVSLYQAAAAMNATARWQDLIAENLAGASVPGARKQEFSVSSVRSGLAAGMPSANQAGYSFPSGEAITNFSPGELRPTGNAMDFALEGPGFFTIQMPDGSNGFTRDGEFHLGPQGQLVTKQGYTVLGVGGPLRMNPNNPGGITVSATGDVSQGSQTFGKMQITEFKNLKSLKMMGGGYFSADDSAGELASAGSTQVRQNFVESGNASPTTEMASLITAMRMFESNQKVLQMQGDRMSRTITDLAGTSS